MGLFDGLFKKRKKSSLIGGILGGGAGALTGASLGDDLLFGKKSKDIKGRFERQDPRLSALLDASQPYRQEGIQAFGQEFQRLKTLDPNKMAAEQTAKNIALTERGLLGSLEDQKRQIAQQTAMRGLGNSSIGIGSVLGAQRDAANLLAQRKADIRTGENQLREQLAADKMARMAGAQGGISNILAGTAPYQRNYMQGAKGVRGGGLVDVLAPIGGAAIGGYFGGPQGASVGMQAGRGIGSILGGMA